MFSDLLSFLQEPKTKRAKDQDNNNFKIHRIDILRVKQCIYKILFYNRPNNMLRGRFRKRG